MVPLSLNMLLCKLLNLNPLQCPTSAVMHVDAVMQLRRGQPQIKCSDPDNPRQTQSMLKKLNL